MRFRSERDFFLLFRDKNSDTLECTFDIESFILLNTNDSIDLLTISQRKLLYYLYFLLVLRARWVFLLTFLLSVFVYLGKREKTTRKRASLSSGCCRKSLLDVVFFS